MEYSAHILVADDDPAPQRVLKISLERLGYQVSTVSSGTEALQFLQDNDCDLLVLDFAMPDLNGRDVCLALRSQPGTENLPVIVLTGMTGEEEQIDCLEAGANDFVTKPVPLPVLSARIQTQLRLRNLRTEMQRRNAELERWRADHETDLEAARAIQSTIVPGSWELLPGFRMELLFKPLIQVGGDIYGWRTLPRNRLFFWLVDATGHGVSAALYTTLAALLFAQAMSNQESPAEILRQVNQQLFGVFRGKGFITASCLLIDQSGQVEFAGAAQPPLLIKRANGKVDEVPSTGTLVGLDPEMKLENAVLRLAPGEGLLLYTDGLYALSGPTGRLTHADVTDSFKRSSREKPLDQLTRQLQSKTQSDFSDDVTALLLVKTD